MLTLGQFLLLCLYALGLRWLVFQYKRMAGFIDWLNRRGLLAQELTHCVYCQTIEASLFVYLVFWTCGTDHSASILSMISQSLLGAIAIGWIAVVTDGITGLGVDLTEERAEFKEFPPAGMDEPESGG